MTTLADFTATAADGTTRDLAEFAGSVVLVVNTASGCGFAPQFAGLQELYAEFRDRGFTVLGFPSNDFKQEPKTDADIGAACQLDYGVTFPVFAKIHVTGREQAPLFAWLTAEQPGALGKRIKWNFTKFLIGRDGRVLARFAPQTKPAQLRDRILAALDG